jgi:hypothetical protein
VLCAIHEKRTSSPAEYEHECATFLADVMRVGREYEPDAMVAIFLDVLEDPELFKRAMQRIEEDRRVRRLEALASAPAPHPSPQKQIADRKADGAHQTQKADPLPPSEDEDDGIDIVEEIE